MEQALMNHNDTINPISVKEEKEKVIFMILPDQMREQEQFIVDQITNDVRKQLLIDKVKCRYIDDCIADINSHMKDIFIPKERYITKYSVIVRLRPFLEERGKERHGTSFYREYHKFINKEYARLRKINSPTRELKKFIDANIINIDSQNYLKKNKNTLHDIIEKVLDICNEFQNINPDIMYTISGFYFAIYCKGSMSINEASDILKNNKFIRNFFKTSDISTIAYALKNTDGQRFYNIYNRIVFSMFN